MCIIIIFVYLRMEKIVMDVQFIKIRSIIRTGGLGHYRNPALCRVFFIGHSANTSLPRAALDKVPHSVTRSFTECRTLGIETHSAKTSLPSAVTIDAAIESTIQYDFEN
jgi:hypothetical protein